MPTYDYCCKSCGHELEVFQGITEPKLRKCPSCGKQSLERLIGPGAGIIFKGNGFYATDYMRKSSHGTGGNPKETAASKSPDSASSAGDGEN